MPKGGTWGEAVRPPGLGKHPAGPALALSIIPQGQKATACSCSDARPDCSASQAPSKDCCSLHITRMNNGHGGESPGTCLHPTPQDTRPPCTEHAAEPSGLPVAQPRAGELSSIHKSTLHGLLKISSFILRHRCARGFGARLPATRAYFLIRQITASHDNRPPRGGEGEAARGQRELWGASLSPRLRAGRGNRPNQERQRGAWEGDELFVLPDQPHIHRSPGRRSASRPGFPRGARGRRRAAAGPLLSSEHPRGEGAGEDGSRARAEQDRHGQALWGEPPAPLGHPCPPPMVPGRAWMGTTLLLAGAERLKIPKHLQPLIAAPRACAEPDN